MSGNASHIANINPFRYRGYYYDTETGFYYLQSRYYDPVVGRFLNADVIIGANGGILGYNSFAYCSNSPVNYSDKTGNYRIYNVSMNDNGDMIDTRFASNYIPTPAFFNTNDYESQAFVQQEYETIYNTLLDERFFRKYINGNHTLVDIDDINIEYVGVEKYKPEHKWIRFGVEVALDLGLLVINPRISSKVIGVYNTVKLCSDTFYEIDDLPYGTYQTYIITVYYRTDTYYYGVGPKEIYHIISYKVYYSEKNGNVIINEEAP